MKTSCTLTVFLSWIITDCVHGSQYKLHHQETATWEEAKATCVDRGHVFAKVSTPDEKEIVEKLKPYTNGFFWIGYVGNSSTNTFPWNLDQDRAKQYWAEGFPGTVAGLWCVRVRTSDFMWETYNCSGSFNFLCEDPYHRSSYVVSTKTKLKGIFMGVGLIGGILLVSCLLLQLPCCRTTVTMKISRIGFGTRGGDRKMALNS